MKFITLFAVAALLLACDSKKSQPSRDDEHAGHEEHDEDEEGDHADHEDHDDEHAGHDEKAGDHDAEENVVHISKVALSKGVVVVRKSLSGILKDALEVPAEVQLPPDHVAHVSPLVDGQLLSIQVSIGDEVKEGQALATLRSVSLGQARAELNRTTALRAVAKQTLERQEKLRKDGISSERTYLNAKLAYDQAAAEKNAALSRLRVFGARGGSGPDMLLVSPIGGTLVQRHATQGENVSPGDALFVIADTSLVWVIGQAYERQLSRVVKDMKANLTLTAYPSRSWSGKVDYIGATVNEQTRTLPIRVEIDNSEGHLRPGLFGSLRLLPGESAQAGVIVPLSAVQTLEGRSIVFVPGDEEGEFRAQTITLGRENSLQVEVLNGLKAESPVVVEGGFVLKSEMVRGQLGHGHAH